MTLSESVGLVGSLIGRHAIEIRTADMTTEQFSESIELIRNH